MIRRLMRHSGFIVSSRQERCDGWNAQFCAQCQMSNDDFARPVACPQILPWRNLPPFGGKLSNRLDGAVRALHRRFSNDEKGGHAATRKIARASYFDGFFLSSGLSRRRPARFLPT